MFFLSIEKKELYLKLGTRIEVTTDNNFIEGMLITVTSEYIGLEVNDGYGSGDVIYVRLREINQVWDQSFV